MLGVVHCGAQVNTQVRDAGSDVPQDVGGHDVGDHDTAMSSCAPPAGVLCSPVRSQGCTAGRGCYLTSTDRICVIGGTAGWGEACSAANACRPGFTCYLGACAKACCSDGDCTDEASGGRPNSFCYPSGGSKFEFGTCAPTSCDRLSLTDNGCPMVIPHCGYSGTDMAFRCRPHSVVPPRTEGQPCRQDNDCQIGYACASESGASGTGQCRRNCNINTAMVGGSMACPSGYECVTSGAFNDGTGSCLPLR